MPGAATRPDPPTTGAVVSVKGPPRDLGAAIARAPFRVLLVDDAVAERELLSILLVDTTRFVVVGEADDGAHGVAAAAELRPDLVVLDISMPGMSGIEALTRITAASPASTVVVVSGFVSPGLAQATIEQGASACLDKSVGTVRLIEELLGVLEVEGVRTG